MLSENPQLLLCYNKGCGNKFDPSQNKEDSCTFHPGNPVFHDAYKSWSCCNKRSIDFTEFLNIKGCTIACHSNVKPPQPEKPEVDKSKAKEVVVCKAPLPKVSTLERPPFNTPLVKMVPKVSPKLKSQIESIVKQQQETTKNDEVTVGTNCKNRGCKATYTDSDSCTTPCIHHPGVPVFHEGLKFWSCCKKRTTDFAVFLEQVGCETGTHIWVQEKDPNAETSCRYDWHQTGTNIIMAIYAKKYDPEKSFIELNPIRVKISLYFPEDNSSFNKDLELYGVVDIEKSHVEMLPTKVEIELKKAEPGNWPKLEAPKPAA
ncbi:hypothetical protein RUM43_001380 [Polyplax serrata]|uniref:Cysteine and histidine-rich domain-containing protein n=1 Tax=Polyplax serrata TaxID=468196 RepID=A0AAN8SEQ0_POLSC